MEWTSGLGAGAGQTGHRRGRDGRASLSSHLPYTNCLYLPISTTRDERNREGVGEFRGSGEWGGGGGGSFGATVGSVLW